MNRRRLLGGLSVVGAVSLAGCPGGCVGPGIPAELAVEAVDSVPEGKEAVDLEEYSEDAQRVIRQAIRDGAVTACANGYLKDDPEAQHAIGGAAGETSNHGQYVRYQRSIYALWARLGDEVYADAAEPPDGYPCCVGPIG